MSRWWFILYVRNWHGADQASDRFLGHLWSLSVEEQFYVVWAVIVFLCSARKLVWVIFTLSLLAPVTRAWMYFSGYDFYEIVRFTNCRMDGLLLGGFIAISLRLWPGFLKRWAGIAAITSAFALFFVFTLQAQPFDAAILPITLSSWTAILFASVVALCLRLDPGTFIGRVLTSGFLANIARYSYAMYLWHLPVFLIVEHALPLPYRNLINLPVAAKIVWIPCLIGLTYVAARTSWILIESPALSLKDRYFARQP